MTDSPKIQNMAAVEGWMPECWNDDKRMTSMFSSLRTRETNPTSYDAKIKFWTELVLKVCKSSSDVHPISYDVLCKKFRRNGKIPMCLREVLRDMDRKGLLQSKEQYEESLKNVGWMSWGLQTFVKRPVSWSFGLLFASQDFNVSSKKFVAPQILHELESDILEQYTEKMENERTGSTILLEDLREEFRHVAGDETFSLSLRGLERRGHLVMQDCGDRDKILKFGGKPSATTQQMPLTEMDVGIMRLKKTAISLEEQVEKLAEDAEKCTLEAKQALSLKQKSRAKSCLRRKRNICRTLEKKEDALENLHTLLHRIHDAKGDKLVLEAYQAGVDALKSAHGDITIDHVDKTMSEMHETMTDAREIADTLSNSDSFLAASPHGNDLSELEEELEALVAVTPPRRGGEEAREEGTEKEVGYADVNIPDEKLLEELMNLEVHSGDLGMKEDTTTSSGQLKEEKVVTTMPDSSFY